METPGLWARRPALGLCELGTSQGTKPHIAHVKNEQEQDYPPQEVSNQIRWDSLCTGAGTVRVSHKDDTTMDY